MTLPQPVYEALRWLNWIVLPAIATLWSALNTAWGWGFPMEAILTTFTSIEAFFGVVLGLSKYQNDKSSLV